MSEELAGQAQPGTGIPDDSKPWRMAEWEGDCTCDHYKEEHGWGVCAVEGCACEAGWCD